VHANFQASSFTGVGGEWMSWQTDAHEMSSIFKRIPLQNFLTPPSLCSGQIKTMFILQNKSIFISRFTSLPHSYVSNTSVWSKIWLLSFFSKYLLLKLILTNILDHRWKGYREQRSRGWLKLNFFWHIATKDWQTWIDEPNDNCVWLQRWMAKCY